MKLIDLHNLSPKRLIALQKSGIYHPTDLLYFFPRRYIDRSNILPIRDILMTSEPVTVVGKVIKVDVSGYGNKKRLEVIIQDDSASLKAVYFKGWKYFITQFKVGAVVALFGSAKQYGRYLSMAHPEIEQLAEPEEVHQIDKLIPIYPSNKHFSKAFISNKVIIDWIDQILQATEIHDFLPSDLLDKHSFPERSAALYSIHKPTNRKDIRTALERFKYEELFLFELSMAKIKQTRYQRAKGIPMKAGDVTKSFFNDILPFELTKGQINALSDLRKDLSGNTQMNRLIQGDVGAGKTIVAIGAMLMAVDSGYQATMMAPTEILAEQHYFTLKKYLEDLGIHFRLLTGGQPAALRRDVLSDIEGGQCRIVIGTHAIFQEKVTFNKLGLVVIDEQHRFGVKQRNDILQKGEHPHLLVMSATPIPRSLAMTIYSDLDISIIPDLPAGRKPVKTAVRMDKDRESIYQFIEKSVAAGDQVYVIFPLIEESEVVDLKDATMGYEKLKKRFPDVSIDLLHGRMKSDEKEKIMTRFSAGNSSILVSTTVIEVGVDVPNASIMIIEHAERFGLSQLHQLRGRIGRGSKQSYCILMPGHQLSKDGRVRLKKMVETTDGFEIAEADLKLRGPGDFLGTKQSGLPDFKFADIVEDRLLLEQAKNDSWLLIREDQDLSKKNHAPLKKVFEPYFEKKLELYGVG
ncbi:MAG: ATP-dependent DNA helicase RecG [Balneolaceae bacterium]